MSAANWEKVPSKLKAALQTLKELHIPFRGPFVTPNENRIFLIDDCIVAETEIIALQESGQFSPENIGRLLSDLNASQTAESPKFHFPGIAAAQNRRRSQRIMLQLSVLVRAETHTGKYEQIQAFTVSVNAHGGLLEFPSRLTVGQKITLVNPQSGKEVGCRVMRVQRSSEEGYTTAFEFEERNPRFWPVPFPPLDWGLTQKPA